MKILKFFVAVFAIFGLLVFSYGYLNEYEVIDTIIDSYKRTPSVLINNEYKKNIDVDFVSLTNDFEIKNEEEIKDIYYTIISSGMNEFTFYCAKEYLNCTSDIAKINNDESLLSQINNFVSVYNSFKSVKTTYTNNGKVTVSVERIYSNTKIEELNEKVNTIYNEIIDISKSNRENIKSIHDYIINNTKYNVDEEDSEVITDSSTAVGPLFNRLATCNGYTDAMSLFLDKLGITNLRISNSSHIWNLVYLDDTWYHLDLTWDDPINDANKDLLLYDYYLKTTQELIKLDKKTNKTDHLFNAEIYNFIN